MLRMWGAWVARVAEATYAQRGEIRLKFGSNVAGGHYEMDRVLVHTTPEMDARDRA